MIYTLNSPEISKLKAGQFAIPKLQRESTLPKIVGAQAASNYILYEAYKIAGILGLVHENNGE